MNSRIELFHIAFHLLPPHVLTIDPGTDLPFEWEIRSTVQPPDASVNNLCKIKGDTLIVTVFVLPHLHNDEISLAVLLVNGGSDQVFFEALSRQEVVVEEDAQVFRVLKGIPCRWISIDGRPTKVFHRLVRRAFALYLPVDYVVGLTFKCLLSIYRTFTLVLARDEGEDVLAGWINHFAEEVAYIGLPVPFGGLLRVVMKELDLILL